MALVEIVAGNLHAGANLRKLEVGAVVDVDDATAERWKALAKQRTLTRRKARSFPLKWQLRPRRRQTFWPAKATRRRAGAEPKANRRW
jgi:hypothetical protein